MKRLVLVTACFVVLVYSVSFMAIQRDDPNLPRSEWVPRYGEPMQPFIIGECGKVHGLYAGVPLMHRIKCPESTP